MTQWEDQYDLKYVDGFDDDHECQVSESVKEEVAMWKEMNARKADYCDHCRVRMRMVYTSNNYFKRQKIGSYCPICGTIKLWIREE